MTNEEFNSLFTAIKNDQKEAEIEAGAGAIANICRLIYNACISTGFNEEQSLLITISVVTAEMKK